ncbi:hypothetical protein QYR01_10485 [Brucella anthropi]|uniref:hypothetical protein n=1 Tax=Brucella anthropi TaxID=529 RepID=UPI0026717B95|nr:hypothetical protein [Brucella anthropi]WKT94522.1 hypothetical protein QYR01_10485 [Brucella anthropi]
MKTIEQIIRDDIGHGGPQLPSDEYEQRIDSILGQMNCAELLTRISNAVAEIRGGSGMRLVYSGPESALCSSMKGATPATVFYTNYRGETSERTITPIRPWFGSTEWHPEPQWLLRAYDHNKGAERDFALKDFGGQELSAARALSLEDWQLDQLLTGVKSQVNHNGWEEPYVRNRLRFELERILSAPPRAAPASEGAD